MGNQLLLHFVCTRSQAWDLVKQHHRFWVSNCGCRENREQCHRSRVDLCLMFRDDISSSGSGMREISFPDVEDIFREAENKRLVTRPFRNDEDRSRIDGICFCCDDCCGYFLDPNEVCDKGELIESTDEDACINCEACEAVCYFGARKMKGGVLVVDRGACYGCGLCVDVCPEDCIEMIRRE